MIFRTTFRRAALVPPALSDAACRVNPEEDGLRSAKRRNEDRPLQFLVSATTDGIYVSHRRSNTPNTTGWRSIDRQKTTTSNDQKAVHQPRQALVSTTDTTTRSCSTLRSAKRHFSGPRSHRGPASHHETFLDVNTDVSQVGKHRTRRPSGSFLPLVAVRNTRYKSKT